MCSEWVNKFAILEDLATAQGCVPVDLPGPVSGCDPPPSPREYIESNEWFYQHCIGGGDNNQPDLGLITHMLNLVRDNEQASEDDEDIETNCAILKKSKLNPMCPEFVPRPRKKERNVAITSLLKREREMKENSNITMNNNEQKSRNFVIFRYGNNDQYEVGALTPEQKENCEITKNKNNLSNKHKRKLKLEFNTANMFKKKLQDF